MVAFKEKAACIVIFIILTWRSLTIYWYWYGGYRRYKVNMWPYQLHKKHNSLCLDILIHKYQKQTVQTFFVQNKKVQTFIPLSVYIMPQQLLIFFKNVIFKRGEVTMWGSVSYKFWHYAWKLKFAIILSVLIIEIMTQSMLVQIKKNIFFPTPLMSLFLEW
jgi:hypothetical protein